jgi:predicted metal-dependent hydrolase
MDRSAAEDARQLSLFGEAPPLRDAAPRRRLLLAGHAVEFRFLRRPRRRLALRIDEHGLTITAPPRAPWCEIEAFASRHARWILAKLAEWAGAGRPRPLIGRSGEALPVGGGIVSLEVRAGRKAVFFADARLTVCLPWPEREDAVRAMLRHWLKARTLETLAPRVAHYARCLGLEAPPLEISDARQQWGVCMADRRIRLSWRLAHLAPPLSDYVAAHEVAHLAELNHSKRFWALLETLYPEWRAARGRLGLAAAALPIL